MKLLNAQFAVLGIASVVASGACYLTKPANNNYNDTLESPTCTAYQSGCYEYHVCPNGIVCYTKRSGFAACFPATIAAPLRVHRHGSIQSVTLCCVNGEFLHNHASLTCTIPWDTVGGGSCIEPEPFPQ